MRFRTTRSAAIALVSAGMALAVTSAADAGPLIVQNGTFTSYTGSAPKDYFGTVNPTSWVLGPGGPATSAWTGILVFVDAPGTAGTTGGGPDSYGTFLPTNPPSGGNFIQADGNPAYEATISQTITGLTVGTHYTVTFWQAASQQQNFSGATTEQWIVSLGTADLSDNCPADTSQPCTYGNSDANASIAQSTVMDTASQSYVDWNEVTVDLVADSTTDILSFLAWGDGGDQINLPPTLFLADVNTVPEPATLSLIGAGLAGAAMMRRRKKAKA